MKKKIKKRTSEQSAERDDAIKLLKNGKGNQFYNSNEIAEAQKKIRKENETEEKEPSEENKNNEAALDVAPIESDTVEHDAPFRIQKQAREGRLSELLEESENAGEEDSQKTRRGRTLS